MKWAIETLRTEALKYKTRSAFKKNRHGAYRAAIRMGIIDQVCSHMELIYRNWTNESLKQEALRYKTKAEFRENNESAYMTAIKRDIFDQICSHMEDLYTYWTIEMLRIEALKYRTRGEFQRGSSAHLVALRRGVLDQICGHMKLSRGSSIAEKELFKIIKSIYPQTTKIRDMKVSIESKPWIKGFEIDILVGNLGIEFDGKYYHSSKKMRKDPSKACWSDEDIRNYHEIKDAWFASKGIKILHIKEEDWNKDKTECIQHCLEFLGA